jgi:hypothetical protein
MRDSARYRTEIEMVRERYIDIEKRERGRGRERERER